MPRSRWPRRWTSTFVTLTRRGSEAPTRTRMGCCASTSPRAPTFPCTRLLGCLRSPQSSTLDRARHWAASHPQKPCSVYCLTLKGPSLRRPLEFADRRPVTDPVTPAGGAAGRQLDQQPDLDFDPSRSHAQQRRLPSRTEGHDPPSPTTSWPCQRRANNWAVRRPPHLT